MIRPTWLRSSSAPFRPLLDAGVRFYASLGHIRPVRSRIAGDVSSVTAGA